MSAGSSDDRILPELHYQLCDAQHSRHGDRSVASPDRAATVRTALWTLGIAIIFRQMTKQLAHVGER
jgi:hypothetical protein